MSLYPDMPLKRNGEIGLLYGPITGYFPSIDEAYGSLFLLELQLHSAWAVTAAWQSVLYTAA